MKELNKHFTFPFKPHGFQVKAMKDMQGRNCSLLRFAIGLGKTVTSTMTALSYSLDEGVEQIIIMCPPILMDQWYEFLQQVEGIPSVCMYRGTIKERMAMDLGDSIILVSYNIFRGPHDHARFVKLGKKRKLCVIADELSLKNIGSKTYRKLKMLLYRKMRVGLEDRPAHKLIALNATPISDLTQVYNWCGMFVPGVYRSLRLFKNAHVADEDMWGNATAWKNEPLMKRNMDLFTVNTSKAVKLPPLVETEIPYSLSKNHMKLYKEVKESCLDALPEDKIELAINSMFSTLQRLILVPHEFGLKIKSPILEFLDGYLEQLGDEGVLIYTRHVIVSKMLAQQIPDNVAIYGGVMKELRKKAFDNLQLGRVKRLVGNLDSLGVGLNLQMLNHIVFAELPFRADRFEQSIGRIYRQGQTGSCFINIPLAKDTLQEGIYYKLLKNKQDIGKVIKSKSAAIDFLK